jgi:hypothetical protein
LNDEPNDDLSNLNLKEMFLQFFNSFDNKSEQNCFFVFRNQRENIQNSSPDAPNSISQMKTNLIFFPSGSSLQIDFHSQIKNKKSREMIQVEN